MEGAAFYSNNYQPMNVGWYFNYVQSEKKISTYSNSS